MRLSSKDATTCLLPVTWHWGSAGEPGLAHAGMRQKTMSKAHGRRRHQDIPPDAGAGSAEDSNNSLQFIKETPEET